MTHISQKQKKFDDMFSCFVKMPARVRQTATPILCSAFTNERRHDRKATKLTAFFANRPSQNLDARHHTLHEQCGWIKVNSITRRLLGTAAALQQSLTRVVHQFHKVLHVLCELAR